MLKGSCGVWIICVKVGMFAGRGRKLVGGDFASRSEIVEKGEHIRKRTRVCIYFVGSGHVSLWVINVRVCMCLLTILCSKTWEKCRCVCVCVCQVEEMACVGESRTKKTPHETVFVFVCKSVCVVGESVWVGERV